MRYNPAKKTPIVIIQIVNIVYRVGIAQYTTVDIVITFRVVLVMEIVI